MFGTSAGYLAELDLLNFYRRGCTLKGYRGVLEPPDRLREAVELALIAVSEGRLRIPIGRHLPLTSATQAFDIVRMSHQGKIVVAINP